MGNVSPVRFTTTLHMRCDEEFLEKIDDLRIKEKPPVTRAELIRKLVDDAWKPRGRK
jgi:hypothetical protein